MKIVQLSRATALACLLVLTGCVHRAAKNHPDETATAKPGPAERALADQLLGEVRAKNAEIAALNERIARLNSLIADTQQQLLVALRKSAVAADATVAATPARAPVRRMTMTWDEVQREAASVAVFKMKPLPLAASDAKDAWARVPAKLTELRARVHTPVETVNGVADFVVTAPGYLLVACNYDYQGNRSGNWTESVWTREQFYADGWLEVTTADLGGPLVRSDNREQVVFVKKVAAGETGRLRCNKYDPPFFITFAPAGETGSLATVR